MAASLGVGMFRNVLNLLITSMFLAGSLSASAKAENTESKANEASRRVNYKGVPLIKLVADLNRYVSILRGHSNDEKQEFALERLQGNFSVALVNLERIYNEFPQIRKIRFPKQSEVQNVVNAMLVRYDLLEWVVEETWRVSQKGDTKGNLEAVGLACELLKSVIATISEEYSDVFGKAKNGEFISEIGVALISQLQVELGGLISHLVTQSLVKMSAMLSHVRAKSKWAGNREALDTMIIVSAYWKSDEWQKTLFELEAFGIQTKGKLLVLEKIHNEIKFLCRLLEKESLL